MNTKRCCIAGAAAIASACAFAVFGGGSAAARSVATTNNAAVASGRGATQKWVEMRIEEARKDIESVVDTKVSALSSQVDAAVEQSLKILADKSNTNAVEEATAMQTAAAMPLANAIIQMSWQAK